MAAGRQLRELAAATARASDAQLLRLVAMVDQLPARGPADELLAPVRPRLRNLRPARPLNLPRLLFLPLDGLLVAPRGWKPGRGEVPRSAINPLVAGLREGLGPMAAEADTALRGARVTDAHLITAWGGRLWPRAAEVLGLRPPASWAESGLPESAYPAIAQSCRTLWRFGRVAWRLRLAGPDGPPPAMARPILQAAAAEGPEALGLLLASLLPHAAAPSQLTQIAAALGRQLAGIAEAALDRHLVEMRAVVTQAVTASASDALDHLTTVLEELQTHSIGQRPARAQVVSELRQSAGRACTAHLQDEAAPALVEAITRLSRQPLVSDAEMERLEDAAAALRVLLDAVRKLDRAAVADSTIQSALALLTTLGARLPEDGPGMLRADALRVLQALGEGGLAARVAGLGRG